MCHYSNIKPLNLPRMPVERPRSSTSTFSRNLYRLTLLNLLMLSNPSSTVADTREKIGETVQPAKIILSDPTVTSGLQEMAEKAPGRSWLGKMKGNGNRDTLVYLPSGFKENEDFELIYHFHGTHSEAVAEEKIGMDRLEQVLSVSEEADNLGKNMALVYPLSAGRRGRPGSSADINRYDGEWMKAGNSTNDDMKVFHQEVLTILKDQFGLHNSASKVTAKGHSAGGVPLMWLQKSGFPFDRMDFLDASYGKWASKYYNEAIQGNPDMEINIFHIPDSATSKYLEVLKAKKGVRLIEAKRPHGHMMYHHFNWER